MFICTEKANATVKFTAAFFCFIFEKITVKSACLIKNNKYICVNFGAKRNGSRNGLRQLADNRHKPLLTAMH